jgi:hypothetical protein
MTIDHTDTTTAETTIELSIGALASLVEVLEHCDEFLRGSFMVRDELAAYCLARTAHTHDWLIDMVSFSAYQYRRRLDQASEAQQRPYRPCSD